MTARIFLTVAVVYIGTSFDVPAQTRAESLCRHRVLARLFRQCDVPAQPQTENAAALEARIKTLEEEVDLLRRELGSMKAERAAIKAAEKKTPADESEMALVYRSFKITNARVVGGPYSPGDAVVIAYELKNTADRELRIPLDHGFSRPFNLVGTLQHWIERQGNESTIQGIPPQIRQQGRKYAAGGSIVPTKPTISPGENLTFERRVSTAGFPAGKYTYYIEYKQVRGGVIQSEQVDFELTGK